MFDLGCTCSATALQQELSFSADTLFLCIPTNFYSLELVFAALLWNWLRSASVECKRLHRCETNREEYDIRGLGSSS
jgi:hypothetical protein